jgi:hypothetical protein
VQFPIGAVLQHSNTPSLRVAGFEDEDDDEDENEAPHEWRPKKSRSEWPRLRPNDNNLVPLVRQSSRNALSELHLATARLGMLSGHTCKIQKPRVETLG